MGGGGVGWWVAHVISVIPSPFGLDFGTLDLGLTIRRHDSTTEHTCVIIFCLLDPYSCLLLSK